MFVILRICLVGRGEYEEAASLTATHIVAMSSRASGVGKARELVRMKKPREPDLNSSRSVSWSHTANTLIS